MRPEDVIARFDANVMRADLRDELIDWVKTLGVKPEEVMPQGIIIRGKESYELHLSEFVLRDGRKWLDLARDDVVTYPKIIDLGQQQCWPAWLPREAMA